MNELLIYANQLASVLNEGKVLPNSQYLNNWLEVNRRITFHSKGIRVPFKIKDKYGYRTVTPANWDEKYSKIINNFILNRHPREEDWSYNFRLGAFTTITQQVVWSALNQVQASVFQSGNYYIELGEDKANRYIKDTLNFDSYLKDSILPAMVNDPNAFICVLEGHKQAFGTNETAKPIFEIVPSENIKGYKENEFIFFATEAGELVLLTTQFQVKYSYSNGKYSVIEDSLVVHKFNELPAIQLGGNKISNGNTGYYESFFQPFVSWADLTIRNLSDHEVLMKNYSYPHKQVVLPDCSDCAGQGKISVVCETGTCEETCKSCNGKGTVSINPDEMLIIKAPLANENKQMYKAVEFINPDVNVLIHSNSHWLQYFNEAKKVLFVEDSNQGGNQSAVSKEFDRQRYYFFVNNISSRLFFIAKKVLRWTSAYLNAKVINGSIQYDLNIPIEIVEPKDFSNKTETELVETYNNFNKDGNDRIVRLKAEKELIAKMYGEDSIEYKKFEVSSIFNPLFGYTINELTNLSAFGIIDREAIIKNTYTLNELEKLVLKLGNEAFLKLNIIDISNLLEEQIKPKYEQPTTTINIP